MYLNQDSNRKNWNEYLKITRPCDIFIWVSVSVREPSAPENRRRTIIGLSRRHPCPER